MPIGAKTMKMLAKSKFFDYKVFGALGPWGTGTLGHRDPGAQGPWGPGTLGHRDPGAQGPWGPGPRGEILPPPPQGQELIASEL